MRGLIVLGFVLVMLGILAFVMPDVMTNTDTDVFGGMTRTQVDTLYVPSWAGIAATLIGLLMIIVGATARPRLYR